MKRLLFVTILMAVFSLASFASTAGQTAKHPRHVRLSLAGFQVGNFPFPDLYDPKEKYFLRGLGDCDGAHMGIILTPEGEDKERDVIWKKGCKRVSIPRLRNGTGVNIGDTPLQVQRKLGKAPDYYSYHRTNKVRSYGYGAILYRRDGNGKMEKIRYDGAYTFHNERLWSISYDLYRVDGC